MDQNASPLMTVQEAAGFLGIGQTLCYELAKAEKIPTIRALGDRVMIPRAALMRWIEEQTIYPGERNDEPEPIRARAKAPKSARASRTVSAKRRAVASLGRDAERGDAGSLPGLRKLAG